MATEQVVLEYLKVGLSTQMVAGAVAVAIVLIFRPAITALISRVAAIHFPGGFGVATTQAGQEIKEPAALTKAAPVPADAGPAPVSLTGEQVSDIQSQIVGEQVNARLWEYRYLNYFLVYLTQTVLDWLASYDQSIPLSLVDSNLMASIPQAEERGAIIQALHTHHLVDITRNNMLKVTPKGREYLQWRGPLPAQLSGAVAGKATLAGPRGAP